MAGKKIIGLIAVVSMITLLFSVSTSQVIFAEDAPKITLTSDNIVNSWGATNDNPANAIDGDSSTYWAVKRAKANPYISGIVFKAGDNLTYKLNKVSVLSINTNDGSNSNQTMQVYGTNNDDILNFSTSYPDSDVTKNNGKTLGGIATLLGEKKDITTSDDYVANEITLEQNQGFKYIVIVPDKQTWDPNTIKINEISLYGSIVTPLAGSVSITGTMCAGETVSVDTSSITPSEALTNGATYSWLYSSTSGGTYTEVGTESTYTIPDDYTDGFLKVVVTSADANTYSGSISSSATAICLAKPDIATYAAKEITVKTVGSTVSGSVVTLPGRGETLFKNGTNGYTTGTTMYFYIPSIDCSKINTLYSSYGYGDSTGVSTINYYAMDTDVTSADDFATALSGKNPFASATINKAESWGYVFTKLDNTGAKIRKNVLNVNNEVLTLLTDNASITSSSFNKPTETSTGMVVEVIPPSSAKQTYLDCFMIDYNDVTWGESKTDSAKYTKDNATQGVIRYLQAFENIDGITNYGFYFVNSETGAIIDSSFIQKTGTIDFTTYGGIYGDLVDIAESNFGTSYYAKAFVTVNGKTSFSSQINGSVGSDAKTIADPTK